MTASGPTRRTVLSSVVAVGAGSAVAAVGAPPAAAAPTARAAGPILKPLPVDRFVVYPTNAEMRWESVSRRDPITDRGALFVRNHTSTPRISKRDYELRVYGDGLAQRRGRRQALRLSLGDLQRFRQTDLTTVLECTGNGRSFFASQQGTPAAGTQWTLGAVGAVRWQGVLLRDLLDEIGLAPDALSVLATGLDDPYVDKGIDHGHVRRPFPVTKALDDALLAWGANGKDLPPDHGYPLRLVLPGWVGIASIKWLGSLRVSRRELTSPWNTTFYRMTGGGYPSDSPPLTVNPVRSAWELAWEARLSAGRRHVLSGRSWSGAAPVTRVEVSLDGGATWRPARIRDQRTHDAEVAAWRARGPHDQSWTRWSVEWDAPAPGRHELMARATDARGRTQPAVTPYNDAGYFFDAVVRHPVVVA